MTDLPGKAHHRDPNQIAYRVVAFWVIAFIVALTAYLIEHYGH
jgi:hypothetical protein